VLAVVVSDLLDVSSTLGPGVVVGVVLLGVPPEAISGVVLLIVSRLLGEVAGIELDLTALVGDDTTKCITLSLSISSMEDSSVISWPLYTSL
jgi:hypothetical protein